MDHGSIDPRIDGPGEWTQGSISGEGSSNHPVIKVSCDTVHSYYSI